MRKTVLKSLSVVLLFIFLVSAPIHAAADARASAWFSGYGASVVAVGNGKLNIDFTVVGTGTMTKLGASIIDIYKSNGTHVTSISYATKGNGYMMGYNTAYHSGSVPFSAVSGQKYYAVVKFFAKDSSGADTRTYTTSIVTAK